MTLNELYELPDSLLACPAHSLHDELGGPTLIHLAGRQDPALVISTLLHGNETSGWDAIRALFAERPDLMRNVLIFIGNTAAAAQGQRTLPGQTDYNRIWKNAAGVEGELAAAVRQRLDAEPLFGAVDLHNNTGRNPHYCVLTSLGEANLGLAYAFSDKAVFVEEPDTVLSRVFDGRCPAVTLELGPVGDPRCADRAYDFLKRLLMYERVPRAAARNLDLFQTRARVHIPEGVSFMFAGDEGEADLVLTGGMEAVNFHDVKAGSIFGNSRQAAAEVLHILDDAHANVTDKFLRQEGEHLLLAQNIVPAMYTTDPAVIRQDCLCYFMERLNPLPG